MPDPSPFDDDAPDAPPPVKRERRPWWRWNIVTLFGVLFVLAWVRELGGLSLDATWLAVFSIFIVWFIGPTFFVEPARTYTPPPGYRARVAPTMDEPHSELQQLPRRGPRRLQDYRVNLVLTGLRRFSFVMFMVGLACALGMLVMVFAQVGQRGMRGYGGGFAPFWYGVLGALASPALISLTSGVLYTLTVIAERLEKRADER